MKCVISWRFSFHYNSNPNWFSSQLLSALVENCFWESMGTFHLSKWQLGGQGAEGLVQVGSMEGQRIKAAKERKIHLEHVRVGREVKDSQHNPTLPVVWTLCHSFSAMALALTWGCQSASPCRHLNNSPIVLLASLPHISWSQRREGGSIGHGIGGRGKVQDGMWAAVKVFYLWHYGASVVRGMVLFLNVGFAYSVH